MQVAADAGVGERLLHLEATHGATAEQVLGRPVAMQAAHHGDLGLWQVDAAVGVVEHELDLADAGCGTAVGAGEEDVGARVGADRARRRGGHRPLQRVGDVRLAGAVRPDDHGDAGEEAQLDLLGERLEAADTEGAQVHGYDASSSRRASASRAAACSDIFLEGPLPVPSTTPSTSATVVKRRRCGGPSESISS